jgi:hypothetical protein
MQRCEMGLNNLACNALVIPNIDNSMYINKENAPMCVFHLYALFHVLGILISYASSFPVVFQRTQSGFCHYNYTFFFYHLSLSMAKLYIIV